MQTHYNEHFYNAQSGGSYRSALQVAPIICNLYKPKTIADIGGGVGTWARAFEELGVKAVCFDGDYVNASQVQCKEFRVTDLEKPVECDERFDAVVCLEVAEHLTPERAESFVKDLCKLSNVVIFSAATPGQGGTNHINERPHDYWHNLFELEGYEVSEALRIRVQGNLAIESWYRKNIFTYLRKDNE